MKSTLDRIIDKVLIGDECWEWIGAKDRVGYGTVSVVAGGVAKTDRAYRAMYELLVGPIPDRLHLDHLCNNPSCVRPAHLEPVTQAENNHRAAERRIACRAGHPYTDESTYVHQKTGARACRVCRRNRLRRKREANSIRERY